MSTPCLCPTCGVEIEKHPLRGIYASYCDNTPSDIARAILGSLPIDAAAAEIRAATTPSHQEDDQ